MRPLQLTPDIYQNELYIEAAPTGKTHCKACSKLIGEGEARVTFHRSMASSHYFHLYCFTPITHVRIHTDQRRLVVNGTEIQEEVQEWVQEWNKQFDYREEEAAVYTEKRVKTKTPKTRRILLESFKFLEAGTVVNTVARICRDWYHVSWEDELWRIMAQEQFPNLHASSGYRKAYLSAWLCSCAHCNTRLPNHKRHMVCPLTQRPKCLQCYLDRKHRPQRLSWVHKFYGITPRLIRVSRVPKFEFDGHVCVYLYQAIERVTKYRKELAGAIAEKETDELDSLFSKELFDGLRRMGKDDFVAEDVLRQKVAIQKLGHSQLSLIHFIMSGKRIATFDSFVDKVRQQP